MFLVKGRNPPGWSGRGGGPNVIVGCVLSPQWSSAAFHRRGGQTGPPRSNAFLFGAADDTGAADDRPAARPRLKRSFVTFDRGGQAGPPRSNDFFGAADDTGAAEDHLTSVRRPKTTENATLADRNISFC